MYYRDISLCPSVYVRTLIQYALFFSPSEMVKWIQCHTENGASYTNQTSHQKQNHSNNCATNLGLVLKMCLQGIMVVP